MASSGAKPRLLVTTTFRLYQDQIINLQRIALDRRAGGAPGRADASAVLRQLLDEHLTGS